MKLRQSGLTVAGFVLLSLLLFVNDTVVRAAPGYQAPEMYSVTTTFFTYLLGGFVGGIVFSIFEFFIMANLFRRFGLLFSTVMRGSLLMLLYMFMIVALSFIYHVTVTQKPPWEPAVLKGVSNYLADPIVLINMIFYFILAILVVFANQIVAIVGRGVLGQFLFARFRKPRIVERVFVFMDLNSSTTIAESIGHVRFFALIQDFMTDAGAEILEFGGEINKYVGDEIIIVWPLEQGAVRGAALKCILAIRARLAARAGYYQEQYGLVPEFKSGIHIGSAMVGELGDWKREVAYMGDVINTTARIQGACKKVGAKILVSEEYYHKLGAPDAFGLKHAGRGRLRGKGETTSLYGFFEEAPV